MPYLPLFAPAKHQTLGTNSSGLLLQIRRLELGLVAKREAKAAARKSLRSILKAAAAKHQQQLKHPSSALRISWMIDKGMWTMLADGEPFAEAEMNNMVRARVLLFAPFKIMR